MGTMRAAEDKKLLLGKRLATALGVRKRNKLFAFSHEMDVSPSTVTRWLQGQTITVENIARIATTLDVSLDWLVLGRGDMDSRERHNSSEPTSVLIKTINSLPLEDRNEVVHYIEDVLSKIK